MKYLIGLTLVVIFSGIARADDYEVTVISSETVRIVETKTIINGTANSDRTVNRAEEINYLLIQQAGIDQKIAEHETVISYSTGRTTALQQERDAIQAKIDAINAAE